MNIIAKPLINDIVKFGLNNFNIEFLKTENRKELETKLIKETLNLYNIKSNPNSIENKYKKGGYYILGNLKFKTKDDIIKYNR